MKAAQERFVASLSVEVAPKESEENETEARRPKETLEVGEGSSEENTGAACALCRDSGSGSPLCFLTLVQVRMGVEGLVPVLDLVICVLFVRSARKSIEEKHVVLCY